MIWLCVLWCSVLLYMQEYFDEERWGEGEDLKETQITHVLTPLLPPPLP